MLDITLLAAALNAAAVSAAPNEQPDLKDISEQQHYQLAVHEQSLAEALKGIEQQTGIQFIIPEGIDTQRLVAKVNGQLSLAQALNQVLLPTGYGWQRAGQKQIRITPKALVGESGGRSHAGSTQTIERIAVTGSKIPNDYRVSSSSVATKTDTLLIETPQAITVVDHTQLLDRSVYNTAHAMEYVAGVQRDRTSGTGYARGFSVGWYDIRRDGMRNWSNSLRTTTTVERIQYLKGPSSVLYGEGSPGAMINQVTKQPRWQEAFAVDAVLGTNDYQRAEFDATGPVNDQLAWRLVGSFEQDDQSFDKNERITVLYPAVTYKATEDLILSLSTEIYDEKSRGGGNVAIDAPDIKEAHWREFNEANPEDFYIYDSTAWSGKLDWTISDTTEYHLNLAATPQSYDSAYHYATSYDPASQLMKRSYYASNNDVDEFGVDHYLSTNLDWFGMEHTVVVGNDWALSEQDGRSIWLDDESKVTAVQVKNPIYGAAPPIAALEGDPNQTTRMGLYLQDQLRFNEQWLAVLAWRFDKTEQENEQEGKTSAIEHKANSPKLALMYQPSVSSSIYVSWSDSFQLPWAGTELADGSIPVPIQTRAIELGAKADIWDDSVSLTAALFDLRRTGEVVWIGSLAYQQGEASSRGLELEVIGKPTEQWQVTGGLTFLKSELLDDPDYQGNELALAPHSHLNLWNTYEFSEEWTVGLGVIAMSQRFGNSANDAILPGYARFDASLIWKLDEAQRFTLFSENLTNKFYIDSAWGPLGSLGAERSVRLSYRVDW